MVVGCFQVRHSLTFIYRVTSHDRSSAILGRGKVVNSVNILAYANYSVDVMNYRLLLLLYIHVHTPVLCFNCCSSEAMEKHLFGIGWRCNMGDNRSF